MYNDEAFYRKCIKKGIILDTNVLVAFLVGRYAGENVIINHERGAYHGYINGDYSVLEWIVNKAHRIIVTRYILSQVSDLYPLENMEKGKKINSDKVIEDINNIMVEDCSSIEVLSRRNDTKKFGYADSSIIEIAREDYAIVTTDGKLLGYLNEIGATAINMDRLRAMFAEENKSLEKFR